MIFVVGMKRKCLRKDVRKCSPPKTQYYQRKLRRMAPQRLSLKGGGNKMIKIRDSEIELSLCLR